MRTVAVILANPRYTGRQTWNRRATDTSGPASTPALSAKAAHPALVTEQDFIAAQQIRAARPADDGQPRRFALAGLIALEPRTSDLPLPPRPYQHPTRGPSAAETLYIREDHLLDEILIRLGDQDGDATLESDRTRRSRVAIALRDSGRFVVCDSSGWRLEKLDSS